MTHYQEHFIKHLKESLHLLHGQTPFFLEALNTIQDFFDKKINKDDTEKYFSVNSKSLIENLFQNFDHSLIVTCFHGSHDVFGTFCKCLPREPPCFEQIKLTIAEQTLNKLEALQREQIDLNRNREKNDLICRSLEEIIETLKPSDLLLMSDKLFDVALKTASSVGGYSIYTSEMMNTAINSKLFQL